MKISIITPSFNQGEFIERTILSVLSQENDENELEYWVIDGGSTDQTVPLLQLYQRHLTWQSEPDRGQSHAVNKGLHLATGEIIGWLNSDDIYYPDTLKKICSFFTEHPDVDVVYGDACFIDRYDKKIGHYSTEPWNIERLKSLCFISQPTVFFRRRVILEYGLLNEELRFCMDYAFWLHLGLSGAKFAYYPHLLAATRVHQETKTSCHSVLASLEAIESVRKKIGYIPTTWFIHYASALVKESTKSHHSHRIGFIISVWANLWKATRLHCHGYHRLFTWAVVQGTFLKELVRRGLNLFKKKLQYFA